MKTNISTYQFTQPAIVKFFREMDTVKNKRQDDYADRLKAFFTQWNMLDKKLPDYKKDAETLAAFSSMTVTNIDQEPVAHFMVNRDEIERNDPALLSRFEKNASKIASRPEIGAYTFDVLSLMGIPF